MTLYLILAGAAALLVLIWTVCRTPDGPKRDAENRQARQLAERGRAQAVFGDEARQHYAHDHPDQPFTP